LGHRKQPAYFIKGHALEYRGHTQQFLKRINGHKAPGTLIFRGFQITIKKNGHLVGDRLIKAAKPAN
jgi:hypothetical protein